MEKITMPKADGQSADIIQENLEQLKQIFPEVIKEGKVDFEALNDLLGNYADTPEERFYLNWAGKANARREAQKRSTGTLRPCPEESVDWDTTENLYIEGDNLEVLKLLQKSYHSRVKMIYIDPPYNTGKDFVYKDNYKDNMQNYLDLTGQDKKLSTNTESDGRYHSNWLNMMYPRLKLARNLLTDDGVIFISIDDNEVANLRKIGDEIFGEENFQVIFPRVTKKGGKSSEATAKNHDYILMYKKSPNADIVGVAHTDSGFSNQDEFYEERGLYKLNQTLDYDSLGWVKSLDYPIEINGEVFYAGGSKEAYEKRQNGSHGRADWGWRWSIDLFNFGLENRFIEIRRGGERPRIYTKTYQNAKIEKIGNEYKVIQIDRTKPLSTLDFTDNKYSNDMASKAFSDIMGKGMFDYTKPSELIAQLFRLIGTDDFTILDFFSGSATTAHAVMQLNAEDGGNRKYICVQIPEPTPEDSEARKAGYATIPEIAKERIRRAGKKIVEEQKAKAEKAGDLFAEELKPLDIGFKVFKLDSSNINAWDSNPDNLETALHNSLFNIKTDRSEDDLLYEILIKYGIELTEKINRHTLAGKTVYEMGAGSLIVCLADNLTTDVAEGIGKLYKEVSPDGVEGTCRVVFKDSGFNGSDEVKTNTMLILKQHGIVNVASV